MTLLTLLILQVQKPVLQTACAPVSPVEGSPPGFVGRGATSSTVVTTNIVSGGVVSGVATAVATSMPPPPPPSYAQSIQQKQAAAASSQPGTPIPPSPVPTTPIPAAVNAPPQTPSSYNPAAAVASSNNPPSYNASIQAKQAAAAIQRALSPQHVGDLPPPPPYPSTAVSRPTAGDDAGLVPATPVLARGSPVINTAKVIKLILKMS